jgi:zinc D-Ala-D-Ala dipeptidase
MIQRNVAYTSIFFLYLLFSVPLEIQSDDAQGKTANYLTASQKNKAEEDQLEKDIKRYEDRVKLLCSSTNENCPDTLLKLASLYCMQANDQYKKAHGKYEKAWESHDTMAIERKFIAPSLNYNKSIAVYKKVIREYGNFKNICEAYYKYGVTFLHISEIDSAKRVWDIIFNKYPTCQQACLAHLQFANLPSMETNWLNILKHLQACKEEDFSISDRIQVQYQKGEVFVGLGEFDQAVESFFRCIETCNADKNLKNDYYQDAIESIARAFSDMVNGAQKAVDFFTKNGEKSYEDYIFYTIGKKNIEHGQIPDAINAFQIALRKFPNYKDAPLALKILKECNEIQKNATKEKDSPGSSLPPNLLFAQPRPYGLDTSAIGRFLKTAGMVNITSIDTTVQVDLKYSSNDNFLHEDVYGGLCACYLTKEAAMKLANAEKLLKIDHPGLSILVYDCARPRSVQRKMWDLVKGKPEQKYVADPNAGSIHNYGCAVDATIADSTGAPLDMGTAFDFMGDLAQPRYEETFLKEGKLSLTHIVNRRLLRKIMVESGFRYIKSEWWHFEAFSKSEAKTRSAIVE